MKTPKLNVKLGQSAYCAYLYADGHLVIIHEENHPKAGSVQWAEIYERIPANCNFKGRLVFHSPKHDRKLAECINARQITAKEASIDAGSDNTKRKGIAVGSFCIDYHDGTGLWWSTMPDLLSFGVTYQPDVTEAFTEFDDPDKRYHWGNTRINAIHRLPKIEESAQVAA